MSLCGHLFSLETFSGHFLRIMVVPYEIYLLYLAFVSDVVIFKSNGILEKKLDESRRALKSKEELLSKFSNEKRDLLIR